MSEKQKDKISKSKVLREILEEIKTPEKGSFRQWGNWGNWSNWSNWANWGNWGNWGNW